MHDTIFSIADLIQYGLVLLALYCVYRRGVYKGVQLAFASMGMEVYDGSDEEEDEMN